MQKFKLLCNLGTAPNYLAFFVPFTIKVLRNSQWTDFLCAGVGHKLWFPVLNSNGRLLSKWGKLGWFTSVIRLIQIYDAENKSNLVGWPWVNSKTHLFFYAAILYIDIRQLLQSEFLCSCSGTIFSHCPSFSTPLPLITEQSTWSWKLNLAKNSLEKKYM